MVSPLEITLNKLRDLSIGAYGREIAVLSSKGIRLVEAYEGFLLCNFIVHHGVSDGNGNWHVGAIATLIDHVGGFAIYSLVPAFSVSVDFTVSFFSTAKVQEEVEIEAKVVGKKERLTSVVVQVRKKGNGELIALGKQWMAATFTDARHQISFMGMSETEMEDSSLQKRLKLWLRGLSNGTIGHEVEAVVTKHTRVVKVHKGFLLCDFTIHHGLADENGNWHVGAIATLVDTFGSLTAFSFTSRDHTTVDFTISHYSTAKVQEEVELKAKVVGKKEKLASVIVEVRKKANGELIALGKLWLAPVHTYAFHQHLPSKL